MELSEIEHTLRGKLSKYIDHPDWDDAVQEGMIRVWKDIQEGKEGYTFWYAVNRGVMWAKSIMFGNHEFTGHEMVRSKGYTQRVGDTAREKIKQYRDDYYHLHGQDPTNAQISRATGLDPSNVARHMKIIKAPPQKVLTRKEGNATRTDKRAYSFIDIDDTTLIQTKHFDQGSFEETLISNQRFTEIISALEDKDMQSAVFLHYRCGWSKPEIGRYLYPGNPFPQQRVHKMLDRALGLVHDMLYPDSTTCRRGHERIGTCKECRRFR